MSPNQPKIEVEVESVEAGEPIDLLWEKRADQLQLEALPTIRASAERWAGSLTALLGAVGLAAILKGPGEFSHLTGAAEDWAKLFFAAAAVLGLIATAIAISAAQATSHRLLLPGAGSYRAASEKAVEKAVYLLACSRWLAVGAVISTLAASGFLWWGARDPVAPDHLKLDCVPVRAKAPTFTARPLAPCLALVQKGR